MNHGNSDSVVSFAGLPDIVLDRIISRIDDPRDRGAISLVCRRWNHFDALSRKHITVAFSYSSSPDRLFRRFPNLESLKLKGQPRAAMFQHMPQDWGGYAGPWIRKIAEDFSCIKHLHLRRMIISDGDLELLARARGHKLLSLKLDRCSGFSTDGLLAIAQSCRCLKTLFLEESSILEKNSGWIRELALCNPVLEALRFYLTDLRVNPHDLELLAMNCRSLVSLTIGECDVSDLVTLFQTAVALEEFGGGSFDGFGDLNRYEDIRFPPRLCSVGLIFMGRNEMEILFPFAAALKKLDLMYTLLTTEDHCQLIQRCPNLETLEVTNAMGDRGLDAVARTCKKLKRLRIELGIEMENEHGCVTHLGLSVLAQGCPELEYLAVYVSDIANSALETIGTYSKNLCDFRLVLLNRKESITELPLDNGVRSLLRGCTKLRRFALCLRPGGLSDTGLRYTGENSKDIRWMLLRSIGESDDGLLQFAEGCPSLQKLELMSCCFSERALAIASGTLPSLRYLWVRGYKASPNSSDFLAMARPFWKVELITPVQENNDMQDRTQVLAYYSFEERTDYPPNVVPLYRA